MPKMKILFKCRECGITFIQERFTEEVNPHMEEMEEQDRAHILMFSLEKSEVAWSKYATHRCSTKCYGTKRFYGFADFVGIVMEDPNG